MRVRSSVYVLVAYLDERGSLLLNEVRLEVAPHSGKSDGRRQRHLMAIFCVEQASRVDLTFHRR